MIYFVIFTISTVLMGLAELTSKRRQLFILTVILALAAVLVLAIFGAIRADSVGTDTGTYNRYFMVAVNSTNFTTFHYDFKHIDQSEFGFTVLNYVISRFTHSPQGFELVCGLIVDLNVCWALFLMRRWISITLGWITFCALFYGTSIDILRQSIAMSMVLLAVAFLYYGKYLRSFLLICLAITLHTTAILGFLIFATGYLFHRARSRQQRAVVNFSLVVFTIILPFLIEALSSFGAFTDKYNSYMTQGQSFPLITTIGVRLPMLIMVLWSMLACHGRLQRMTIWIYSLIIQEFLMFPLFFISPVVGRLVLYFGIAKVIGYPMALHYSGFASGGIRFVIDLFYIGMLIFIFYNQVIINNNGEIFPYVVNSNFLY